MSNTFKESGFLKFQNRLFMFFAVYREPGDMEVNDKIQINT